MFDLGLTELMVVGVVALVVIGPERLPKVARTAGLLLGRLQRYVSDVKSDINREIQLDELKNMQKQMTEQVTNLQASVTHEMREVESSVNKVVEPPAVESPAVEPPAVEPPAADVAVSPAPTSDAVPAAGTQSATTPESLPVAAETPKS